MGKLHGLYEKWYENGEPRTKRYYQNDEILYLYL